MLKSRLALCFVWIVAALFPVVTSVNPAAADPIGDVCRLVFPQAASPEAQPSAECTPRLAICSPYVYFLTISYSEKFLFFGSNSARAEAGGNVQCDIPANIVTDVTVSISSNGYSAGSNTAKCDRQVTCYAEAQTLERVDRGPVTCAVAIVEGAANGAMLPADYDDLCL